MGKYTCEEFDDFLDRPVAYHRIFKLVADAGCNGGVMLSQAHYWSLRTKSPDGWFYKTVDEWEEETALTRYEQETVRRKLRATGFWHEALRGVPAKLHFKIDRAMLREAMIEARDKYKEERVREQQRREAVTRKRAETKSAAAARTGDASEASKQYSCDQGRSCTAHRQVDVLRTITESTQKSPESTSVYAVSQSEPAASVDEDKYIRSSQGTTTDEIIDGEVVEDLPNINDSQRPTAPRINKNGTPNFNHNEVYVAIREECDIDLATSSAGRIKNAVGVAKKLINDGATVDHIRGAATWCRQDKFKTKNWLEPTFLQDGYTFLKYGKGEIKNDRIANTTNKYSKADVLSELLNDISRG